MTSILGRTGGHKSPFSGKARNQQWVRATSVEATLAAEFFLVLSRTKTKHIGRVEREMSASPPPSNRRHPKPPNPPPTSSPATNIHPRPPFHHMPLQPHGQSEVGRPAGLRGTLSFYFGNSPRASYGMAFYVAQFYTSSFEV